MRKMIQMKKRAANNAKNFNQRDDYLRKLRDDLNNDLGGSPNQKKGTISRLAPG